MHHAGIFSKALALTAIAAAFVPFASNARSNHVELDRIYTMSNDPDGNAVLEFEQASDGRLVPDGQIATGGRGTGGGLGNQGGLATDGELVFVVNAGSDDVSVLREGRGGLRLLDRTASGGIQPVSITVHGDLVYVLNAGSDSIAGFTLSAHGRLHALPGSEQPLSGAGVGAAQIQFSHDGRTLIVTEKNTNQIVTFVLNRAGVPVDRHVMDSPGDTPFGFALGRGRQVLVSEAAGGAANASSVTSYRIARDGTLHVLDPQVATNQSAACWVAVTPDGRFAYVTNTGSGTVSKYRVRANGELTLMPGNGIAASTGAGSAPIDLAFSEQGQYLHVLGSGDQTITTYRVGHTGELTRIGAIPGLPVGTNGLISLP
jgi:6-phosphogluconolactonase (cycloisomerase 2 family)